MTLNPAVERVVDLLGAAGFILRPRPVKLGAIEFDFAAVMTAGRGLDLIVVADTAEQPINRVGRALEGLSRALDRLASRRPITLVLVGPRPQQGDVDALSQTARVLLVGSPHGDVDAATAAETLSVLLPLSVPDVESNVGASWQNLAGKLDRAVGSRIARPLLEASTGTAEDVRTAMRELIVDALVEAPRG
jgi:ABC-type Fe2+-enterobactin transport system substrate-binding protein